MAKNSPRECSRSKFASYTFDVWRAGGFIVHSISFSTTCIIDNGDIYSLDKLLIKEKWSIITQLTDRNCVEYVFIKIIQISPKLGS